MGENLSLIMRRRIRIFTVLTRKALSFILLFHYSQLDSINLSKQKGGLDVAICVMNFVKKNEACMKRFVERSSVKNRFIFPANHRSCFTLQFLGIQVKKARSCFSIEFYFDEKKLLHPFLSLSLVLRKICEV